MIVLVLLVAAAVFAWTVFEVVANIDEGRTSLVGAVVLICWNIGLSGACITAAIVEVLT